MYYQLSLNVILTIEGKWRRARKGLVPMICNSCDGWGEVRCSKCEGTPEGVCETCNGSSVLGCERCDGAGNVTDAIEE